MQQSLQTLEVLHSQFSSCYPCPSLISAINAEATVHLKSRVVLRRVLNELMPSVTALEMERQRATTMRGDDVAVSVSVDDYPQLIAAARGNPIFRALVMAILQHGEEHHDGGWAMTFLMANGLKRLLWASADTGNSRRRVATGLVGIARWIDELMLLDTALLVRFGVLKRLDDPHALRAYVASRLRLRGWADGRAVQSWVSCVIEGVMLCSQGAGQTLSPGCIRFRCLHRSHHQLVGGGGGATTTHDEAAAATPQHAQFVRGLVLDWQLSLENQLLLAQRRKPPGRKQRARGSETTVGGSGGNHDEPIRVLLVEDAIEAADVSTLMAFVQSRIESRQHQEGPSRCWLLVACQRTIAPRVRAVLYRKHILSLERLSVDMVGPLRAVCGCRVVRCVEELTHIAQLIPDGDDVLGSIEDLRAAELAEGVGGRYATVVVGLPGTCKVNTLVMYLDDMTLSSLVEEQVSAAFRSVCSMFTRGALVVEGAGGWERWLGTYLRCRQVFGGCIHAPPSSSVSPCVVEAVVDTLLAYHRQLQPSGTEHHRDDQRRYQWSALQLATIASARKRRGCPLPAAISPLHATSPPCDGEVWSGLPPVGAAEATSAPMHSEAALAESQSQWVHYDSWWSKQEATQQALQLMGTMLCIESCDCVVRAA